MVSHYTFSNLTHSNANDFIFHAKLTRFQSQISVLFSISGAAVHLGLRRQKSSVIQYPIHLSEFPFSEPSFCSLIWFLWIDFPRRPQVKESIPLFLRLLQSSFFEFQVDFSPFNYYTIYIPEVSSLKHSSLIWRKHLLKTNNSQFHSFSN